MRNVGRNVDEISRPRLIDELQTISPAKTRPAAHDVDYSLQLAMMMRSGPGIGVHDHRSRPEFLRTHPGGRNGLGARHARSLRGVAVKFASADDSQAVILPVWFFFDHIRDCKIRRVIGTRVLSYSSSSARRPI